VTSLADEPSVRGRISVVARYRAVLFDWRGTLAWDPPLDWWIRRALESVGRAADPETVEVAAAGLTEAGELAEVLESELRADRSAELNRSSMMLWFDRGGLDAELAEALYLLDFDPASHPLYPDVPEVLAAIRALGVKIALVSDIHFDLRVDLAEHGVGHLIDTYVLSFEHGIQKPDPRMFAIALDALDVEAGDALMVGDRASHDGGAASIGIPTLILPAQHTMQPRGLDTVLRLLA
jgi:HAD superfamily hydrolase (TIGR01509 family)